MPTLSIFFGIIIRMYWSDNDRHKPPHFHAHYGDDEATFTLDGEILAGSFLASRPPLSRPGHLSMRMI